MTPADTSSEPPRVLVPQVCGALAETEDIRQGSKTAHGVPVHHAPADMSVPDRIAATFAAVGRRSGGINMLVDNAGIQHVKGIESFPSDIGERIPAVNLIAAFHTIRRARPAMRQAGCGRVVNSASAHALVAATGKSAYVAAKHGLAGPTKTVALQAAQDGISCNCVSPGYVGSLRAERQSPGANLSVTGGWTAV